jgi:flagellar hook-associated protein 1 FlgK
LAAYQAALQVVGNNIANVATPGYTRTNVDLAAVPGANLGFGQIGTGVRLVGVRRAVSEAINARLRNATSDKLSASTQQSYLDRIEGILDPLGDVNLGSLLGEFFKALNDLQNNPQNYATRGIVVNSGKALAERIRGIRGDLLGVRDDLNTEIKQVTQRADQLAAGIAALNTQITTAEAGGAGPASALRDQRDQALGQLSELFSITAREQPSGAVNVYIGNEALIQFGESFGLTAATEIGSDGLARAVVRFGHNNGPVVASGGQVAGLINARDADVGAQMSRLDTFAAGLINEVNKIHAGGKGLAGFSALTGVNAVIDPAVALSTAGNGLAFPPKTGSFFIDVKDTASGSVVRTQINVDLDGIGGDSTLNSVAAAINADVAQVTATVLADGRLQLTAANGYTFSFADDTSGFLAAMGLNTFFTGKDSLDININSLVAGNPNLVAAAVSDQSGDGSNATALAALQDQAVSCLGGVSLNQYYTASVADLAVSLSSARSAAEAGGVIFDSLSAQRESVSGVNLDEETVALIAYQRAYQGAAKYMSVVDDMLQTLLTMIR